MAWHIETIHVCRTPVRDIPAEAKTSLKQGGHPLWECDECHRTYELQVKYGDQRDPGEWYSFKRLRAANGMDD